MKLDLSRAGLLTAVTSSDSPLREEMIFLTLLALSECPLLPVGGERRRLMAGCVSLVPDELVKILFQIVFGCLVKLLP